MSDDSCTECGMPTKKKWGCIVRTCKCEPYLVRANAYPVNGECPSKAVCEQMDPDARAWQSVADDTYWLDERDGSVWRIIEVMGHVDGNASLVLELLGGGPARTKPYVSLTQKAIYDGPFTQLDEQGARQLVKPAGWSVRAGRTLARWLRRMASPPP